MIELRRYLAYFSEDKAALVLSGLLLSVSAALPSLAVLLVQRTLDTVLHSGDGYQLMVICGGFSLLYLLAAGSTIWRTHFTKRIAWRVAAELRLSLHTRYMRLPPHSHGRLGERMASLTTEVDEVQYGVSAIVTAVRNPMTLFGLIISAAYMAPGLMIGAVLFLPVFLLVSRWAGLRLRGSSRRSRLARERLSNVAQEQLLGLSVIQDFQAEDVEIERFQAATTVDRDARVDQEFDRVLPSLMVKTTGAVGVALLLWLGGLQVMAGNLQTGELIAFAAALGLMLKPLSGMAEVWGLWQRSLASLERVHQVLEGAQTNATGSQADLLGPPVLKLSNVSIKYDSTLVLDEADLEIAPGTWVAVVGASGAGKSTLLSLVSGVIPADSGVVSANDVDVRELFGDWCAAVRQDDFLFSRTIRANMEMARPGASRQAVKRALLAAGVWEFVSSLRLGMDSKIGELSHTISGGERQRLCLARALLKDAPVLLLDEATNQVDMMAAAGILRELRELAGKHTILMVAHDPAVAEAADMVVFIAEGRLSSGSHLDLCDSLPAYGQWFGLAPRSESEVRGVH